MHDPVARRDDPVPAQRSAPAPGEEELNRAAVSEPGVGRPCLLPDHPTGMVAGHKVRLREKPFELAAEQRLRGLAIQEHRELEARRAGIKDEDRVGHCVTSSGTYRCAEHVPCGHTHQSTWSWS